MFMFPYSFPTCGTFLQVTARMIPCCFPHPLASWANAAGWAAKLNGKEALGRSGKKTEKEEAKGKHEYTYGPYMNVV